MDNKFVRRDFPKNELCGSLAGSLTEFSKYSFYIRGSLIEQENPHPNADLDLFIIHELDYFERSITKKIIEILSSYKRLVDLHILNIHQLKKELPQRLLFFCRAIHLVGPGIEVEPVSCDADMITSHWRAYNPEFVPDVMHHSNKSRVCALKNLTRCFGLISLIDRKIFTRDIKECLEYANEVDTTAHSNLSENWQVVDFKVPMNLKPVKDFLLEYQKIVIEKLTDNFLYQRYEDIKE
ncbi:MAG: hypothetical protein AB9882_08660 [Ignavibacteriaceae bacterium]